MADPIERNAAEIGAEAREAYNRRDRQGALAAIHRGDTIVTRLDLTPAERKRFWDQVQQEFDRGRIFIKAENSALHDLLRELEAALQQRAS